MSRPTSPALTLRQFYFVGASVLAAMLAHVRHLPASISALMLALVAARWLQRNRGGSLRAWIKLPLIAAIPLLIIAHYGNVFGREPGSALACSMLALKLLETRTRRDGLAAVCFASFVLMSALLFDTDLVFTLLLFSALGLLLATLRELEPQPNASAPPRRGAWPSLRSGLFALAAATPLALCVFLFFPRLDSPLWRTPGDASARSGISDSMAPGSIQQLLLDDSAAFRVDFDGPPPARAQLYWRGPVLTDFDGATWTRRPAIAANDAAYSVPAGAALAKYDIALEPDDVPWLFALDIPLDAPADAVRNSDMTLIHMNADRRRPAPVTEALRYQVRSALDYRLEANLDPAARAAALALPPDFNPRSVALGARWRRDLDDEQRIVASALELFHNEFFYTLSPPEFGRDSIDEFLFAGKRGFCEHYAAAFVFLMRAAGIPARIVTGYQGGYFNKVGNYLIVRQSDAHAWSEVWLAGRGWVRVDPTAAVSPQRVELGARAAALATGPWYQTSWLLSLRNQFDLVNRGWNSLIVQFNAVRQRSLLTPFGIDQADYAALTWVLIGTSSILLGLVSFWVMRNPRRRIDPLDAAYDELCAKLARAGVARAPNEGPLDFAARVQSLHASRGPFVRQAQALLSQYVSLRYARALISMPERENFARAVRGLRVAARA